MANEGKIYRTLDYKSFVVKQIENIPPTPSANINLTFNFCFEKRGRSFKVLFTPVENAFHIFQIY